MKRTVVGFEPLGDQTVLKLVDAPTDIPGIGENAIARLTMPDGTLVERGRALLEQLSLHPPVKAGLGAALSLPLTAEPAPLYFHVLAACADELPWEQLYDDTHGFCALDRRWPIGRIAKRRRPVKARAFVPPLRIVAVLSAAGRSGVPQLNALLDALGSEDARAIDVHVHVISGEQAVLDTANAAGRANVSAELIAPTSPELARQISQAKPHILHLLCHGGAVAGVRTLAFATLPDFDAEDDTGSLRLKVADLVSALLSCDPWLVVLSACETAEATDSLALAHEIVCHGIPAAVGMRRLVDLTDTNRFCEAMYPEVLAAVRGAVGPSQVPEVREIDWATSLTAPRVSMGGAHPSEADSWSDPVLYVQDDPLRVYPGSPSLSTVDYSRLRAHLDFWEGYLATLDPLAVEPAVLEHVGARIAELRSQLPRESG
ncbi:CHAT domain-containing protein [Streptomyces sporangiiformans]|uniref:CHAT domain-containing protein n=1 Tax=Streptomyces sporangiiformans TaxID=2315329 RepID=A0A505DHP6_9ACTN|nr:CHAT domain-containing protein [Streptomyces sporangiiformans]TPQ22490.1 CHAT domain-containing protein [Streptomyces sporangiiformans]